ncbi:pyrethroid hydrolase Ces2a-like isoform X2 [Cherax quadricarinatus]|uniref:pyrethroid hydrolase Ces2a-like isoform X2 n=1 Tax=Cherax quadricarinatus TaxID=27406 RepID=UPI00387EC606
MTYKTYKIRFDRIMKTKAYVAGGFSLVVFLLWLGVWVIPVDKFHTVSINALPPLTDRPEIQLNTGRIRGVKEEVDKGRFVYLFRGIPYAKPPVGELRFKAPVAPESWTGVRECSKWAPVCPQDTYGSEDCLYLNVFTPYYQDRKSKLPVIVYIHGGSFLAGGTSGFGHLPLLTQDVVLVTLQYRLGVLGFLSTEDQVLPGNLGLQDQLLALVWVRDNIARFGGDSEKVTILGSSAGAASVHLLMFNPHAKGLFSQVIMQSGSAFDPWVVRKDHKSVAFSIGRMMGCQTPDVISESNDSDSEALLKCLKNVSLNALVPAFLNFCVWNGLPWVAVPRVDHDYLPDDPAKLLREGRFHKVPMISGVNQHEGIFVTRAITNSQKVRDELIHKFQEVGPKAALLFQDGRRSLTLARLAFQHYVGGVKADPDDSEALEKLFGDRFFNIGHDETWLSTSKQQQQPVFTYMFKHHYQGSTYVTHSSETHYVFWSPEGPSFPKKSDEARVSLLISKLWANFAATGDPTPDDSLGFKWLPASPKNTHHLAINTTPTMESDTRAEARQFWFSLPTRHNKLLYPERKEQYLTFFDDLKNTPSNKL